MYKPLPIALMRTATLPFQISRQIDELLETCTLDTLLSLYPWLRFALFLSSPELMTRIEQIEQDNPDRLRDTLRNYLIRMTTRSTPFGLFATTASIRWSAHSAITIDEIPARVHTYLDVELCVKLCRHLQDDDELLEQMLFHRNNDCLMHGGFLHHLERMPETPSLPGTYAGIQLVPIIKTFYEQTADWVSYHQLYDHLTHHMPDLSPETFNNFLIFLIKNQILYSDLYAAIWDRQFLDRITAYKETSRSHQLITQLTTLKQQLEQINRTAPEEFTSQTLEVFHNVARLPDVQDGRGIRVEASHRLTNKILNEQIGQDACRIAEILLKINPPVKRPVWYDRFVTRFRERYNDYHEIPLLEALNPHTGCGLPDHTFHDSLQSTSYMPNRDLLLSELLHNQQNTSEATIHLDTDTIEQLTHTEVLDDLPPSLEVGVQIIADHLDAIDNHNYLLAISSFGQPAGRLTARFLDSLQRVDREEFLDHLQILDPASQIQYMDFFFLPIHPAAASVTCHPRIYPHEVRSGTVRGMKPAVPLNQLMLVAMGNRLFLRWPEEDVYVRALPLNAIAREITPQLARFLITLSKDGFYRPYPFDWGSHRFASHLPRVQFQHFILSPAKWRLHPGNPVCEAAKKANLQIFKEALFHWKYLYKVPDYIKFKSLKSNFVLLNLQSESDVERLQYALSQLHSEDHVAFEESYSHLSSWLQSQDGYHITELLVSMKRTVSTENNRGDVAIETESLSVYPPCDTPLRRRPPGSDWLYLNIYSGTLYQNVVLIHIYEAFLKQIIAPGITGWFFLRFADPDPHIRLRIHGSPPQLQKIFPELSQILHDLMHTQQISHFNVDTYYREIERYGGDYGMKLSEEIFHLDSQLVIRLVKLIKKYKINPVILATLSINNMMKPFGMTVAKQHHYLQKYYQFKKVHPEYRIHKGTLRQLLSQQSFMDEQAWGQPLNDLFIHQQSQLKVITDDINKLYHQGKITVSPYELLRSYIHMHCVRLLGLDRNQEQLVIELLMRTLKGLL